MKVLLLLMLSQLRIGPYLSWDDSTTTTIRITWHTYAPDTGILVYGTDAFTDTLRDTFATTVHAFKLTGLTPGTRYQYRVEGTGFASPTYTFRTSSTNADSVVFVVFGDTRSNDNAHAMVVNAIIQKNPEFVIHTGDLVSSGSQVGEWYNFFNIEGDLIGNAPLMPCIGNHDEPTYNYLSFLYLPENEEYYTFEYGNVFFVALNTEAWDYTAQRTYLENRLSEASQDPNKWLIVYFHRPPYSWGGHGSDYAVRQAFCDVMENHHVSVVFNGHNHFYQRTVPINGVTYIVTGGGGAPLYTPGQSSLVAYAEACYHFVLIKATAEKLTIQAIRATDGVVIDSLTLFRTAVQEPTVPAVIGPRDSGALGEVFDITGRFVGRNPREIRRPGVYLIRKPVGYRKVLILK